ncbi:FecCD family ABC transporter permease [Idiomarina xiamenensis]|uniref:Hemin ABC transporter permease n=1 Tax=Idiomarina xiamenensis 10-D-4 TaxID=740709 RepID=K2LCR7_9GAMM|nr:iron ABC transporter permease [Idiomarina xiamenensis]EKE87665.1 hemin ABC transporter permease [Idiomarina xiamenensis 10-D-4]
MTSLALMSPAYYRQKLWQKLLFMALLLTAMLLLAVGPVTPDLSAWLQTLLAPADAPQTALTELQRQVVVQIRLPRLVLAVLVGAVLAQSGSATQALCRNPLADPALIGVSAGAAVAALAMISLGPQLGVSGSLWVTVAAFVGALLSTLLIYRLARHNQQVSVATLLLAGVAINALAGALIGLLSYFASDDALRLMTYWQMGSLAGANWQQLWPGIAVMLISLCLLWRLRSDINVLLLGEQQARYLGIDVARLKRRLIVLVALGVGGAVAMSGMIGFVGLVVPHIARLMVGADIRRMLPVAMLLGALVLALADGLAKLVVMPAELPIGIVTALLGAPFFIYLLLKQKRSFYAGY